MLRNVALALLPLLLAVLSATAAPRGKTDRRAVRSAAVSSAVKSEMSRYSLSAFENCDATNARETNVVFVGGVSSPEYVTFALKDKTLSKIDCSRGGVLKWTASKVNGIVDSSCEMNETGPHTVYTIFKVPVCEPYNGSQHLTNFQCDF